ncbi:transglutaminase-like cysteine peptidase [Parendozoicomonas sp. Alg238-R29]|uniref:transglutaminase-like cysteine peptidase n=1 Tax=Parendozoicomonas sp. Alg238-R29 TaxID=2993446 RepID=UPI00248E0EE4|nr:transglutaminase-like cysteine peptidase [Parendozoicomonas sp. Alg238-R29]
MKSIAAVLAAGVIGLSSAAVSASSLPANLPPPSAGITDQRLDAWEQLVARLRSASDDDRLREVNNFFNSLRFLSDQKVWGQEDYWASPSEFLNRGTGDCEDYAIAKYISLRRLGVDDSRLRLAYVRSLTLRQAHMVLLVETGDGEQVVLDNLTSAMQSPQRRGDLEPVYSFNSSGLWLLDQQYHEQHIGQASRLSHWVSLQEKSRNPGIWPSSR